MDVRQAGGRLDLRVARVRAPVADVVADGVVEQHGVLRHDADRRPQAGLRHVADVLAVDQNRAAVGVVEAEQQARDGGFARARRAHDGNGLAGGDREADALQDRPAGVVAEMHVAEFHLGARDAQGVGVRAVGHLAVLAQ
ncbi:hypothetical protein D9M68_536900 [compost metagenome]